MKTSITYAVAAAAISAITLTGCTSGGNDAGATAPATSAASSPTSSSPKASAPAGDPATGAPDTPTTSGTPSPATSEAPATRRSGALASKSDLVALAAKVGCGDATPMKPKKSAPAGRFGIPWAVNCLADSNQYIIMSAAAGKQDDIITSLMSEAWTSSKEVGYVSGDGWMVIGGKADSKQPPVREDAEEVQKVVGGTVRVVG